MKALVLGASGATGKLVVMELASKRIDTRIVVRESAKLSAEILDSPLVEIIRGNIAEFSAPAMKALLQDCDAVFSCLGHNITIKGMFGKPRNLVTDTICKIAEAAREADRGIKLILMSTTAYTDALAGEKNSFGEMIILSILKLLLPPHLDNVEAADYLRGQTESDNGKLEWVAVRPDTLVNDTDGTEYYVHGSPVRSPIFDAGKTSRMNVSRFMVELLVSGNLWKEWRFKMPVVYDKS